MRVSDHIPNLITYSKTCDIKSKKFVRILSTHFKERLGKITISKIRGGKV